MYKFIGILAIVLGLGGIASNAGILDDLKVAITGHIADAEGRIFGEDMHVSGEVIMDGVFDEDAVGQDAAHWAKGSVSIVIKDGVRYVQLGSDFNSGPLPDGHVYVSVTQDINDEADFNNSVQIDLGELKLGKGASFYEIPEGTTVNSVTVWCKRFGAYIGSADVS